MRISIRDPKNLKRGMNYIHLRILVHNRKLLQNKKYLKFLYDRITPNVIWPIPNMTATFIFIELINDRRLSATFQTGSRPNKYGPLP